MTRIVLTGNKKLKRDPSIPKAIGGVKSACLGKRKLESKLAVEYALQNSKDPNIEAYWCTKCKAYHLGHNKKKTNKKR